MLIKEIKKRTNQGQKLAIRYPKLNRKTYKEFLIASREAGLDLDFVTSNEMFEALQK